MKPAILNGRHRVQLLEVESYTRHLQSPVSRLSFESSSGPTTGRLHRQLGISGALWLLGLVDRTKQEMALTAFGVTLDNHDEKGAR